MNKITITYQWDSEQNTAQNSDNIIITLGYGSYKTTEK